MAKNANNENSTTLLEVFSVLNDSKNAYLIVNRQAIIFRNSHFKSCMWFTVSILTMYVKATILIHYSCMYFSVLSLPVPHCHSVSFLLLLPLYSFLHFICLISLYLIPPVVLFLSSLHHLLFNFPIQCSPAAASYLSVLSSACLHSCQWVATELAQLEIFTPQVSKKTSLFHSRTEQLQSNG